MDEQEKIVKAWEDFNNLLQDALDKEIGIHLLDTETYAVSAVIAVNLSKLTALHSVGLVTELPWSEEELLIIEESLAKIAIACQNNTGCDLTLQDCKNCLDFMTGVTVILLPFYLANPAYAAVLVKELEAQGLTINDLYEEE